MSTTFIKEGPDKRGRIYIIEGTVAGKNTFNIKRFICQVSKQESERRTSLVADMILARLKGDEHDFTKGSFRSVHWSEESIVIEFGLTNNDENHEYKEICQVQEQETPEETAKVAELLLSKLNF